MTIDEDKSASITTVAGAQFKIDDGGISKVAVSPLTGRRLHEVTDGADPVDMTTSTGTGVKNDFQGKNGPPGTGKPFTESDPVLASVSEGFAPVSSGTKKTGGKVKKAFGGR